MIAFEMHSLTHFFRELSAHICSMAFKFHCFSRYNHIIMKSTDKFAKSNYFIIYLYAIVSKTVVLEKNNLFLIKEIQSSLKNLFKRFKRRNTTSQ